MSAETMYAPETGPFSGKKMSARERTRRLEEMFKVPNDITLPSHDAVQTCGCGEERDYRSWNWTPKEKPVGDLAKRVKPVSVCGLEFADVVTEDYGGDGEPCVLALDGGKVLSSDPSCSYTSPGAPRLSKFVEAAKSVEDARDSIVCVDLSHNALAAGDLPGAVQLVEFAQNCKVLKLCGSGLSTRLKDVEAVVSMLESLKGHNALKYVTLARTRLSRDGRVMRQLHEQLSSEAPTLIWMSSTQVVDASQMKVIAEEWNDKQTFTQSEEAHREFYDKHVLEREPCAFPVPW